MHDLTLGKARGLQRISDGEGRYGVLAIDQRPPIFNFLQERGLSQADAQEKAGPLKRAIAQELATAVTGLLVDPLYGYDHVLPVLPRSTGLLLTLEDHAFEVTSEGFRRSKLIANWDAAKAVRAGAEAMKFLVWYRPDAPEKVLAAQHAVVQEVGEMCRQAGRPFVLEILTYPLKGEQADSYAERQPVLVEQAVKEFADPRYGVDLYKLPLPGEKAAVREWGGSHYSLAELSVQMRELTRNLPADWVVLSAGVTSEQFAQALDAALDAGARGYMAGRALWWQPIHEYPDDAAIAAALREVASGPLEQYNRLLRDKLEFSAAKTAPVAL